MLAVSIQMRLKYGFYCHEFDLENLRGVVKLCDDIINWVVCSAHIIRIFLVRFI